MSTPAQLRGSPLPHSYQYSLPTETRPTGWITQKLSKTEAGTPLLTKPALKILQESFQQALYKGSLQDSPPIGPNEKVWTLTLLADTSEKVRQLAEEFFCWISPKKNPVVTIIQHVEGKENSPDSAFTSYLMDLGFSKTSFTKNPFGTSASSTWSLYWNTFSSSSDHSEEKTTV